MEEEVRNAIYGRCFIIGMKNSESIEIDTATEAEWTGLLTAFDDANIYQTWQFGARRWGEGCLSHLVVKSDGVPVILAQIAVKKLPVLGYGIGYILWGPLWKRRGHTDIGHLRLGLKVLKEEYAGNRKLLLRINPNEVENHDITGLLSSEGFLFVRKRYHTFRLDLTPSLEQLRKGLNQKWRNQLNRAEKNGLSVAKGVSDELYGQFAGIYQRMISRKQFDSSVDIRDFRVIQANLPDELKMRIFICSQDQEPIAALVGTKMGNTGIYLLGSTNEIGMKSKGAYLLQWRMIEWLKEQGCSFYDLGGIDPQNNPGVHHFKSGLGGTEIWHIGEFEFCQNKVSLNLIHFAAQMEGGISKIKRTIRGLSRETSPGEKEVSEG
jgi:lipid II:glycine glycyltransferase (peptidoglycan interpeptide bridge formation enzyme)